MDLFSKKPSQFDNAQDKQLKDLVASLNGLWKAHNDSVIANNQWFKLVEQLQAASKQQQTVIQQILAYMNSKDATDKAQDERINGFLSSLANLTKQSTETTT